MKDQQSNSGFKHPVLDDPFFAKAARKWLEETERVIAEDMADWLAEGCPRRLIPADELRAAGAFGVPKAWRKSLGGDKSLFDELPDDDARAPVDRDEHQEEAASESESKLDS